MIQILFLLSEISTFANSHGAIFGIKRSEWHMFKFCGLIPYYISIVYRIYQQYSLIITENDLVKFNFHAWEEIRHWRVNQNSNKWYSDILCSTNHRSLAICNVKSMNLEIADRELTFNLEIWDILSMLFAQMY